MRGWRQRIRQERMDSRDYVRFSMVNFSFTKVGTTKPFLCVLFFILSLLTPVYVLIHTTRRMIYFTVYKSQLTLGRIHYDGSGYQLLVTSRPTTAIGMTLDLKGRIRDKANLPWYYFYIYTAPLKTTQSMTALPTEMFWFYRINVINITNKHALLHY